MNPDMYAPDMYTEVEVLVEKTTKIEDKNAPVYYVNEEKRTVVCVLNFDVYDMDWMERNALVKLAPRDTDNRGRLLVRGIAKCDPSDTFDVEFGKRLAWVRAHRKYHKLMAQVESKTMDYYAKEVVKYLKKYTVRLNKIEGLVAKEEILVTTTKK